MKNQKKKKDPKRVAAGKKARRIGVDGEGDARRALCDAFEVPYSAKRYPRSSSLQGVTETAPDILGFPWHVEVKAGSEGMKGHPGSALARAWRDKVCREAMEDGQGKPPIIVRKARRGAWCVSSYQEVGDAGIRWLELPLWQWAAIAMFDEPVRRWRDEVFYGAP